MLMMYVFVFCLGFFIASTFDLFRVIGLKRQLNKIAENENMDSMYRHGVEYSIKQIERWLEL